MSDPIPLSPAGQERRALILRMARAEAGRRRRRRHAARTVAAGAGVVLLTVLLIHRWLPQQPVRSIVFRPAPATQPVPATQAVAVSRPPALPTRPKTRQIVIQVIRTEPNIVKRLATPSQKPSWRRLSDDELIQELADAGCPAGLAWIDGRELVLYRSPDSSNVHYRTPGE